MRLSVGKDASTATARRLQKEAELNATNNGLEVTPENGDNGNHSLAAAVTDFLEETKLTKKPKTLAAYRTALGYFQESCPKLHLEDIERRDLLKFAAFLRDEKEQAPRSVLQQIRDRHDVPKSERDSGARRARTTGRGTPKRNRRCTRMRNWTRSSRLVMRKRGFGTSSS